MVPIIPILVLALLGGLLPAPAQPPVAQYEGIPADDRVMFGRDIFHNNAARFLRLSDETVARHHGRSPDARDR